jgi:hypothetical protein
MTRPPRQLVCQPSIRSVLLLCLAVAALLSPMAARAAPEARPPAVRLSDGEECTIAVISGSATADGRPILWKNRDTAYTNNEVVYFEDGTYRYIALTNAGDLGNAWIGVNEEGFAILNALSYNLPDDGSGGITNGQLMKQALQICATVNEFDTYLTVTNEIGRANPANLAVIDAKGGAAIFEADADSFVRFDVPDPAKAPEGFLVRANFSLSGDTTGADTFRYNRCRSLILRQLSKGKIDVPYILQRVGRDLRSVDVDPYPLPFEGSPPGMPGAYGYVNTVNTINRRLTTAAGAILGVMPGEDPVYSTFYAVLGPPIVTIPLPLWVAAGQTPPEADGAGTSPLCDAASLRNLSLYDYPAGGTLLNTHRLIGPTGENWLGRAEEIEKWIFRETDAHLARWHANGLDQAEMMAFERITAQDGYNCFMGGTRGRRAQPLLLSAGPNPTSGPALIRLAGAASGELVRSLEIYDVAGRRVARLAAAGGSALEEGIRWNGFDDRGVPVPSGVYFVHAPELPGSPGASLVVLR